MLRTEAGAARRETGGGRRLLPPPSSPLRIKIPSAPCHSPLQCAGCLAPGGPWGVVVLARFRRAARVTDAKRTIRTEPDVANPVSPLAPAPGVRGRDAAARGDGRGGARRKLWGTGALRGRGHRSRAVLADTLVFVNGGCILGPHPRGWVGSQWPWARSLLPRVKGRVTRTRVG